MNVGKEWVLGVDTGLGRLSKFAANAPALGGARLGESLDETGESAEGESMDCDPSETERVSRKEPSMLRGLIGPVERGPGRRGLVIAPV